MSNYFYDLLDLRKDQEQPHIIDQSIRSGVKVVGTNLWVLIFAILVASVGLNVNSTAVIIGAMLISPLMGPIVGIGYGVGINDFDLIKLSLRNLVIFTFISILASTLYFTISPLDIATPELLARTSPNLWDVLIAFFGGSAGIIALTRKSISNVVPGVAIATALMPPLCTAGFGIAQGNWEYFGGAFFLYCINSVFIAFSTLIFVNIFRLPKHKTVDEGTEKRTYMLIGLTLLLMIVPSAYLAYQLVQQNSFSRAVSSVIDSYKHNPDYVVLTQEVDNNSKQIYLTVGGNNPPKDLAARIESRLKSQGMGDVAVMVRYSGSGQVDISSLKTELRQEVYNNLQDQVTKLDAENDKLTAELAAHKQVQAQNAELFDEIRAQYPSIGNISISQGQLDVVRPLTNNTENNMENGATTATAPDTAPDTANTTTDTQPLDAEAAAPLTPAHQPQTLTLVTLTVNEGLSEADKKRITDWLKVRFENGLKVLFLPNDNGLVVTPKATQPQPPTP